MIRYFVSALAAVALSVFPVQTYAKSSSHSHSSNRSSGGSHAIRGYVKKNGTYVAPSRATNPNRTKNDNYSTRGNTNPYTGTKGTKPRDGER